MKLEKWQREKLRELFDGYLEANIWAADLLDVDELIGFTEQVLSADPPRDEAELAYERFMAEWKQVGVWVGGKPVRAKLARLAKAGKLDEVWSGLERLRNDPNRPRPEYVPRPMTWLNQERWNDDPYPAKGGRVAASGAVLGIQLDQHGMGSIEAIGNDRVSIEAPQQIVNQLRRDAGPGIAGMMQQGRW